MEKADGNIASPFGSISKREFLKLCCLGGAACVLSPNLKAESSKKDLSKWTIESKYYSKKGTTLYCELCPNECIVLPGKKGDCRVRINKDGKMYSINYGNPCAVHIDPIEKKPLLHFLPESSAYSIATAGCSLKCLNCQNWTISQASPEETNNYDLPPDKVVYYCLKNKCESIAYTYSEPTVFYEYMYDTAKLARAKGIKNILVSCGNINEKPLKELCKYIDAANIDLKSFDDGIYKKLNGGRLEPILNALKILRKQGVWLEITNLVVPQWTDDLAMIRKMCKWLKNNNLENAPLHFSRFHPQYKLDNLPFTPVKTLEKARKTALEEGIRYVYIGNVPGTNAENTYCPSCGKLLIERKGFSVLNNYLKDGKCDYCGKKIAGVWT